MYYALFEKKQKKRLSVILNILKCFRKLSMLLKEAWVFFKKEEKKTKTKPTSKSGFICIHKHLNPYYKKKQIYSFPTLKYK